MIRQIFIIILFFTSSLTCISQTDSVKTAEVKRMTFDLPGRHIVKPPPNVTDQFEKGIVVVQIVVDSSGTVVKATPNSPGTTTTSVQLFARARQAAFWTKFSKAPGVDKQIGTLTIAIDLEN